MHQAAVVIDLLLPKISGGANLSVCVFAGVYDALRLRDPR
jgi:hypothetical protein